jgi:hypothetical protein
LWRTAKAYLCRAFFIVAHGKGLLIVVRFNCGAQQKSINCRAFFGQRMAKVVTRRLAPAPSVAFFCHAPPHDAQQR